MDDAPHITRVPGLRLRRQMAGMRKAVLAREVGVNRTNIGRYEAGLANPGLPVLERLAAALNCTPADLLTPPSPAKPVSSEDLAQMEAELQDLEARIKALKEAPRV